jgi:hypothetical protein
MAQRRGDDRSDLDEVKALAAKARSETGGPVVRRNPAELSGVRPRRDSVIGMRVTPPPRTTNSELPSWFWGVLGCLSVLLVGFAGLFFLGRSGKLGPLLGDAVAMVTPAEAPAPPPAPSPVAAPSEPAAPVAAPAREPEPHGRAEHGEHAAHAEHAAHPTEAPAPAAEPPAPAADEPPAPAGPAAAAEGAAPAAADDGAKRAAKGSPSAKGGRTKAGETTADDGDEATAKPARPAAAAAKPAAADDSDDDSPPGQDDVEKALDALAAKVRGCFVKYQIKGTARVRLVATPAGKAESVSVTGDFEDTPTGLCVESIVSEASLPTFKGAPLKLSQSYQLR